MKEWMRSLRTICQQQSLSVGGEGGADGQVCRSVSGSPAARLTGRHVGTWHSYFLLSEKPAAAFTRSSENWAGSTWWCVFCSMWPAAPDRLLMEDMLFICLNNSVPFVSVRTCYRIETQHSSLLNKWSFLPHLVLIFSWIQKLTVFLVRCFVFALSSGFHTTNRRNKVFTCWRSNYLRGDNKKRKSEASTLKNAKRSNTDCCACVISMLMLIPCCFGSFHRQDTHTHTHKVS